LIVGGGVSDVETNPRGRQGRWDKHGRWREDGVRIGSEMTGSHSPPTMGWEVVDFPAS